VLERRRLSGGVVALVSPELEADGYLVAFTERSGGSSSGPFAALNLGLRVGDEPAAVMRNRRHVCQALGVKDFACAEQVHGDRHARVRPEQAGAGFSDPTEAIPAVDALVAESPGLPVAVMMADCVGFALVDRAAVRLSVVHAGWRGVASGIVTQALSAFDEPDQVRAVLGPSICIDHYEVGEDVARAVSAASGGRAPLRKNGSRLFIDIRGAVAAILRAGGVRHVEQADACTACEPERFFSYRRDGLTGRQALVASIL
jgi:purine-nucleoside/S-methyl-5'-thioadenosine phosphorylase / adenosine deaminase